MRKVRIPHDATICKAPNRIERCFNKLKPFRRFATRYDRRALNDLAIIDQARWNEAVADREASTTALRSRQTEEANAIRKLHLLRTGAAVRRAQGLSASQASIAP